MPEDAISRYRRNADARDTAQRKRNAAGFRSVVYGLLLLIALAAGYTLLTDGVEAFTDLTALKNRFTALFARAPEQYNSYMDEYVSIARTFLKGELSLWKTLPDNLKPKNAPAGTIYYALVLRENGFDLYTLKMGGLVELLSPFGKPIPSSMAQFKKACANHPYFISAFGRVFACASTDLKAMDNLRQTLLGSIQ